jgi:hypothetical protein
MYNATEAHSDLCTRGRGWGVRGSLFFFRFTTMHILWFLMTIIRVRYYNSLNNYLGINACPDFAYVKFSVVHNPEVSARGNVMRLPNQKQYLVQKSQSCSQSIYVPNLTVLDTSNKY